jgi:putative methyltransferase (TIGR04325 family)
MKALLTHFIPPILLKALKQLITSSAPRYETYDEAFLSCQNDTYENIDLVNVVVDKNLIYRQKLHSDTVFDLGTLRTLIALGLSKRNNDALNVVDFGGGAGYHFTVASKALGQETKLKWNVVETIVMAKEAQSIAVDGLKFFDNTSDAVKDLGDVDLVFTSSALQYCPSPIDFLKQLIDINAKYIYITRTPFCNSYRSIITTQESKLSANGPGPLPNKYKERTIKYPVTYACRQEVENILSEKYEIRFKTHEGEGFFNMPNAQISMDGYFCVRIN